jgi:pectate lyase
MALGDDRSRRLVRAGAGTACAALVLASCTSDGGAREDTAGSGPGAGHPTTSADAAAPAKACGGRLPAFPGAEGFGCATPGGRGGQVLTVTNLDDSGPGSLREALEASGKRVVVFAVSGTIDVREQIVIDDPYLTVAGQTAPGGGITLKAADDNASGLVDVSTHDVVIRFMRFRTGAPTSVEGDNLDGINIWRDDGHDVIIDHNSFSWAVDENASIWDNAHDITFSWNIIAQGLRESTHSDGEHSKGLLVSGDATEDISVHHNLFVHNTARNPQVTSPGRIQVVNNVIFNYGDSALQTSNPYGPPQVEIVGNYFKAGPDSDPDRYEIDAYPIEDAGEWHLHLRGNVGPHGSADGPQTDLVSPEDRGLIVEAAPLDLPAVTTTDAEQALEDVLMGAGARVPYLDPVDAQMIDDVHDERGGMINDVSEVGGWPDLPAEEPPADEDSDGMPDTWETAHDLDPGTDDSADDRDGDGYTNVEEYVNDLVPQ